MLTMLMLALHAAADSRPQYSPVPTLSVGRRTFLVVPSLFCYISTEEV
jgi:hypothetical protein